jgi:hypothetical protein
MRTYVFFNKNTGEIVHTHQEVALMGDLIPTPTEDFKAGPIMEQLADQIDPEDVEVLDATGSNELLLNRSSSLDVATEPYVDVQQQVISEREKGASSRAREGQ